MSPIRFVCDANNKILDTDTLLLQLTSNALRCYVVQQFTSHDHLLLLLLLLLLLHHHVVASRVSPPLINLLQNTEKIKLTAAFHAPRARSISLASSQARTINNHFLAR